MKSLEPSTLACALMIALSTLTAIAQVSAEAASTPPRAGADCAVATAGVLGAGAVR